MDRRPNPAIVFVALAFFVVLLAVGYEVWFYSNCLKWHTNSYITYDKECIAWDRKGRCITTGLVPEQHQDTVCDVWKR